MMFNPQMVENVIVALEEIAEAWERTDRGNIVTLRIGNMKRADTITFQDGTFTPGSLKARRILEAGLHKVQQPAIRPAEATGVESLHYRSIRTGKHTVLSLTLLHSLATVQEVIPDDETYQRLAEHTLVVRSCERVLLASQGTEALKMLMLARCAGK